MGGCVVSVVKRRGRTTTTVTRTTRMLLVVAGHTVEYTVTAVPMAGWMVFVVRDNDSDKNNEVTGGYRTYC